MQALKHAQYLKSLSRIGTTLSTGKGDFSQCFILWSSWANISAGRLSSKPNYNTGPVTARPAVETPMLSALLQRRALESPHDVGALVYRIP